MIRPSLLVTRTLVTGACLILAACGSLASQAQTAAFQDLAGRCLSSVGEDGYGIVEVTRDLTISNVEGEISVSCTLHLRNTATLTINNSQLRTRNLIISDDRPDSQTSTFKVEHSTLSGVGSVAMVVDLRHPRDTIAVHNSTIGYDLGVWVTAGGIGSGTDVGGGKVEVIDSTVRSTGTASRGIRIAASSFGGVGNFVNDTFQTPAANGLAILYAGTCHEERVTGAPAGCSSAQGSR